MFKIYFETFENNQNKIKYISLIYGSVRPIAAIKIKSIVISIFHTFYP